MNLKDLSIPLSIDQIDFRVQSINKGGYATILAYKDARVDMERLDDVVGPLGWKREHSRDNHNCVVSIFDPEAGHWVGKEDTGTESNAEAQKGLASDSFKRACFNWGIGRELYDYPLIQVKLEPKEFKEYNGKMVATWDLRLKEWEWESVWAEGTLRSLTAKYKGKTRYEYKSGEAAPTPQDYTPEQLATFKMLIASEDGWGLKLFGKEVGQPVMDALFNSAPKNEKTKLKSACRDAVQAANNQLKLTLLAIRQAISDDSVSALDEIFGEIEPESSEHTVVMQGITEIEHIQIAKMREEAA